MDRTVRVERGRGGFMPEFSSTGITRSDPARQSGWENGVLIRKKSWHFLILMNRPERQRIGVLQRSDSVWEGGGLAKNKQRTGNEEHCWTQWTTEDRKQSVR